MRFTDFFFLFLTDFFFFVWFLYVSPDHYTSFGVVISLRGGKQELRFDFIQVQEVFLFSKGSVTALQSISLPIQLVPEISFPGKRGRNVKLSKLRKSWPIPLLSYISPWRGRGLTFTYLSPCEFTLAEVQN